MVALSLATNGVEEKEKDSLKFLFFLFVSFGGKRKGGLLTGVRKESALFFFLKEGTRFVQRRRAEPWFLTFVFLLA